ncbi:MAG TPA: helix-turn-helix transcriptional regulator [Pseudonocardiaceae bacterium]|nr:helix-turn-helix transcriptional regulator [Pseudonocardiaceae bacterium]
MMATSTASSCTSHHWVPVSYWAFLRVSWPAPSSTWAHCVDLGTLLGPVAGELVDRLRVARTWTGRFRELDRVLTRIVPQRDGPAPELAWAWRRLTASHGRVEIATLAREVGWSRRHLGERFRREYGLTPKVAGRVMRWPMG